MSRLGQQCLSGAILALSVTPSFSHLQHWLFLSFHDGLMLTSAHQLGWITVVKTFISPALPPQRGGLAPFSTFPSSLVSRREGSLKAHLRRCHGYTSLFLRHLSISHIWSPLPLLALDMLKQLTFSNLREGCQPCPL